ncbi:unnamed protein product [Echinostoma caproni]|uniref:Transposase n=1 Tax=Echinostoma caproni TaxID=27848 RepID=A0A183BBX7_9TREM|nr:unnamed protein product [Echinostoma caproni]
MADRVYADQLSVQSYTQPPPPSHSTDNAELVACGMALVTQVQALTLARDRPRQRRRTRSNHWSRSPPAHTISITVERDSPVSPPIRRYCQ